MRDTPKFPWFKFEDGTPARGVPQFPIIPRKEAFINWYERVGADSDIQEYREFLNKNSAHKIVYVDFRRVNNA